MTVRAPYFTLLNLGNNDRQRVSLKSSIANIVFLHAAYMIKLQYDQIRLSTIDTRVFAKISLHILQRDFLSNLSLSGDPSGALRSAN